ncbi:MAG: hydrogenase maturation protease [Planctomycetota bacterium]|jgi:hydrogenase maturation protease
MKTLILALGNPILSDDAVAYEVADRLAKRCIEVDIIKSSAATMDIIPKLAAYERLVVIDSVQLGSSPPGTVHRFSLDELADTVRSSSPHDINFATAFQMAKEWGYDIPLDIRIYGIEVKELLKFSEAFTPEVAEKLDEITEHIFGELTNQIK